MERLRSGNDLGARRRARAAADVLAGARAGSACRGIADDRATGAQSRLDRLARQALADHVELVQARIVERDHPALPLVRNLHLEAEDVAELALERFDVGVGVLRR